MAVRSCWAPQTLQCHAAVTSCDLRLPRVGASGKMLLMSVTIHQVLGDLRGTALDQRDKGDKFERLIASYLRNDPEWTARFSDVWLWSDWPGRHGRPDTGIDLVAANRDRDDFTAIQCKFYEAGRKVAKEDIDSFLSASMRPEDNFTQRVVFDTSAGWSKNAEETMAGVAQRVDIGYLADAQVDWSQFNWKTPEVLVPTGPKSLRPHQDRALKEVAEGLAQHDRGKLIMACGTGKTFTSLKIAETLVGEGGTVLFLVPSIQLLSQSLREWMANTEVEIRPFAVCSDVRVGRQVSDDADMPTIDLTEPATTDAVKLVERMTVGKYAKERMTVVFSTYQSIDVIIDAQSKGLGDFDLVICDEAHRTTGVTLSGQDESMFVKVHDSAALKATKRLYMTATPRVFGDDVRKKATENDAVLADMGDEAVYGPELHRLGFGDAVEADLLTDYKVLVLAVDEAYVAENFQQAMTQAGEIKLDEAAKLIGCWNGLAKNFGKQPDGDAGPTGSLSPMRTAVAFAQNIKASQAAATAFPTLVDRALLDVPEHRPGLRVEAQHVDGTMGIHERNTHLSWLKAQTPTDTCRILTNAKCLSEGVDVPALDAVLFLTPRSSQVDVVQSVGRVMRKAPGKELGYIILPVIVPSGISPEDSLRDNERYKVVWQVLQALRSHDDRFHALVNQIDLNKKKPARIEIIPVTTPVDEDGNDGDGRDKPTADPGSEQMFLEFPTDQFRDAMFAKIVQKVGERRYWETWAKDVADIANRHMVRIRGLLADETSPQAKEFAEFLKGLRANLNDGVSAEDAIEMLAQHLVTRPIFDALFGHTRFVETNPVAKIMELMLASLDEVDMTAERENLEPFYASVRRRAAGVDNAEGKQRILVELYDKFFAAAFKKTVDKLGIVYTPIEIVDFILRSADAVMREEFGRGLTDEGVHILDGFTGTGTFLVRLLQSGLITSEDLPRKYASEMAGQEILLLAYYIAAANLQMVYEDLTGESKAFPHLALADTFQAAEDDDQKDLDVFTENNDVLDAIEAMKIDVIVGNPPYSRGQDSANDDNANESYPALDAAIRRTYADRSTAKSRNSLYDSYIRAIKWASLRLHDRGIVAFVTNGGFVDSNTADGMRRSLAEEFTSIHVYNLRGNQIGAGEQSRKEGGKVFGGGSRATVAITLLVKNPARPGVATVHLTSVDDYLSREDKLRLVAMTGSVLDLPARKITPNDHGDWANQRRTDFAAFTACADEPLSIFGRAGKGVLTSRDSWVINPSDDVIVANLRRATESYNRAVGGERSNDPTDIKWSSSLEQLLAARSKLGDPLEATRLIAYRPFELQKLTDDRRWIHRPSVLPWAFPLASLPNKCIYWLGRASSYRSPLMAAAVPDYHLTGAGSGGDMFPRWRYERVGETEMLEFDGGDAPVDGYRKIDNITDDALAQFAAVYADDAITKDDIFDFVYGLLHSPDYQETYAADLKRMQPRVPFTTDFWAFAKAGKRLSELHLGYQTVKPYPLTGLDSTPTGAPYAWYSVGDKKMRFGKPTAEQKAAGEKVDRSVIHYNARITVSGIPEAAYRYMVGSRSGIEWIIDRYYVKTDKASGIVNDPNDWSREVGDPRYILDLLARVVTVSLETMKIVDALPPLELIEEEK